MPIKLLRTGGPQQFSDEWSEAVISHARRITSLRNLLELLKSTWDWNLFGKRGAQCFGATIDVTDIDMAVERNGYLLAMETKLAEAPRELPTGQAIMFKRLLWTSPVTILIVWGNAEAKAVVRMEAWRQGPTIEEPARFCAIPDFDGWLQACRDWYSWADLMPPTRYVGPFWSFDRQAWITARLDEQNATPMEQERLKGQW